MTREAKKAIQCAFLTGMQSVADSMEEMERNSPGEKISFAEMSAIIRSSMADIEKYFAAELEGAES